MTPAATAAMLPFFEDLPLSELLQSGLIGGALAGAACGVIGPYVTTRRMVFLIGAIAHIVIGGIGAVLFLKAQFPEGLAWLHPLHGALVSAVGAAVLLAVIKHRARERLDTLIGALWATGMAAGLALLKYTEGYHTELMSYLFGNISLVTPADAWMLAGILVVILVVVALWHKRFLAVCLDEDYAALQGVSALGTDIVLMVLVALATVALTRMVGLLLVIALLSLPAATAGHLSRRMPAMVAIATALGIALTTVPRIAVYGTRMPPEPAIVLSAGVLYLLVLGGRSLWRRTRHHASDAA